MFYLNIVSRSANKTNGTHNKNKDYDFNKSPISNDLKYSKFNRVKLRVQSTIIQNGMHILNLCDHYKELHHINNCLPPYILLKIRWIHGIINSEHSLYSTFALYSLYNTLLGENIQYFMYE